MKGRRLVVLRSLVTIAALASVVTAVQAAPALAANTIYWGNFGNNTIGFANLDGSGGGGQLSTTGATEDGPWGLAIDLPANKIYWSNDDSDTISFANLDGGAGGQLDTTGTTPDFPLGIAIDPATNKIYATSDDNNTISFVNLDGSGGGQLNTTGATVDEPEGVAIDPDANKVYWGNFDNDTISFANADDTGGGGQLPTTGATQDVPVFPVLLKIPSGAGAPGISGGSAQGSVLSCSQGSWAADQLGSFLYQAPQSYSYSWTRNGTPISGATSSSIIASSAGSYTCSVTASNHAGAATETSAAFTVSPPPPPSRVTRTSIGNQQITLTTPSPSVCTADTSKLAVRLTSTKKSKGAKLKFSKAAFYIGKGVKHKHHKHGKVVITYTANATKDHVPATVDLSLTGLKPGTQTLKVVLSYKETKRKHGHKKTVTVTKTIRVKFSIC